MRLDFGTAAVVEAFILDPMAVRFPSVPGCVSCGSHEIFCKYVEHGCVLSIAGFVLYLWSKIAHPAIQE
jgi:hypothetical protein